MGSPPGGAAEAAPRAEAPLAFLAGGGEMGDRIRAFDWSRTALGAADGWSPALRTMLRILLANRFPHILWWGPDYVQFYNDAYRPIPGTKHPDRALGRPARECWSEIWHVIGPLIDTPFTGGPATWMEDILLEVHRHGFTEESHFTIAYSPVPDETAPNGIGGVLATVHEITEKVIGERRVLTLRDLGAEMIAAKSAEEVCRNAARTLAAHDRDVPFALLYLIDGDEGQATLAGTCGAAPDTGFAPATIDLRGADAPGWLPEADGRLDAMHVVTDLRARCTRLPPGPWADPPDAAVLLPIRSHRSGEPAGFLLAGISARLKLDELYRSFLGLSLPRTRRAPAERGCC
jgi:hypothetical protein